MQFPANINFAPFHWHAGRFWNTGEMVDVLSIHYGATPARYKKSWLFRTLIAIYREQYLQRAYGKGYGKDWQEHIKPDLLEYTKEGRMPLVALRRAADFIRQADMLAWALRRNEPSEVAQFVPHVRIAHNK
jgi:hypothetical protein